MSKRFVSGGTIDPHGNQATSTDEIHPSRPHIADTATEWATVQQELEDVRQARAEQRMKAASTQERSLYDVLQANQAAKQAAFEEQNKIRNQFRALDDDEIEFLDEVKAAKRLEEERVRRETEDGLKAFREQQRRSSGGGAGDGNIDQNVGEWSTGRKRKRGREKEKIALVKRKTGEEEKNEKNENGEDDKGKKTGEKVKEEALQDKDDQRTKAAVEEKLGRKKSVGLVSYGSDDSDDD